MEKASGVERKRQEVANMNEEHCSWWIVLKVEAIGPDRRVYFLPTSVKFGTTLQE